MKTAAVFRLVLLFVALAAGTTAGRAEDLNAVRARITQRLDAVNALKDRLVAGESNQGFLEMRGSASAADQKLIADENTDRRTVYAALAAKTGATPEVVGRQRAQQLAQIARRGVWIQDASGAWRRKE
ncbi:MAG: YdbL family protein [Opitutaceae bacterium]|nr:YdbL family protein [Opitutaceae bacterium]